MDNAKKPINQINSEKDNGIVKGDCPTKSVSKILNVKVKLYILSQKINRELMFKYLDMDMSIAENKTGEKNDRQEELTKSLVKVHHELVRHSKMMEKLIVKKENNKTDSYKKGNNSGTLSEKHKFQIKLRIIGVSKENKCKEMNVHEQEQIDYKNKCDTLSHVMIHLQNKRESISNSTLNVHQNVEFDGKHNNKNFSHIEVYPQIKQRPTSTLKMDVPEPDENTRKPEYGAVVRSEKEEESTPRSKMGKVDDKREAVACHEMSKHIHAHAGRNDKYHYTRTFINHRYVKPNKVPYYMNQGPQISEYSSQSTSHWHESQNYGLHSLDYESQRVHFSEGSPCHPPYKQPPGDEIPPSLHCGASAADHFGENQSNCSPPLPEKLQNSGNRTKRMLELVKHDPLAQQSEQPNTETSQESHQVNRTPLAREISVSSSDAQVPADKRQQSASSLFKLNINAPDYIPLSRYQNIESAGYSFLRSNTVHKADRVEMAQSTSRPNHSKHINRYQKLFDHHFVAHYQHCGIQPQIADSGLIPTEECRLLYECVHCSALDSGAPAKQRCQQPQRAASHLDQFGDYQQPVVTDQLPYKSQVTKNKFNPRLAQIWKCLKNPKHDDWLGLLDPDGVVNMRLKDFLKVEQLHLAKGVYTEFQDDMPNYNVRHILEVYDISPQVETVDVLNCLKRWVSRLVLKWVDDNHLILAFMRAHDAEVALETPCPVGKLRYLKFATISSKFVALNNGLVSKGGSPLTNTLKWNPTVGPRLPVEYYRNNASNKNNNRKFRTPAISPLF